MWNFNRIEKLSFMETIFFFMLLFFHAEDEIIILSYLLCTVAEKCNICKVVYRFAKKYIDLQKIT